MDAEGRRRPCARSGVAPGADDRRSTAPGRLRAGKRTAMRSAGNSSAGTTWFGGHPGMCRDHRSGGLHCRPRAGPPHAAVAPAPVVASAGCSSPAYPPSRVRERCPTGSAPMALVDRLRNAPRCARAGILTSMALPYGRAR